MWPNAQETVDLVTFTKEIFDRKFYFFVQCNQIDFQLRFKRLFLVQFIFTFIISVIVS